MRGEKHSVKQEGLLRLKAFNIKRRIRSEKITNKLERRMTTNSVGVRVLTVASLTLWFLLTLFAPTAEAAPYDYSATSAIYCYDPMGGIPEVLEHCWTIEGESYSSALGEAQFRITLSTIFDGDPAATQGHVEAFSFCQRGGIIGTPHQRIRSNEDLFAPCDETEFYASAFEALIHCDSGSIRGVFPYASLLDSSHLCMGNSFVLRVRNVAANSYAQYCVRVGFTDYCGRICTGTGQTYCGMNCDDFPVDYECDSSDSQWNGATKVCLSNNRCGVVCTVANSDV